MAAILPPIAGQRNHVNQPPPTEYVQQKEIPPIKGGVFQLQTVKKPQCKADRELMEKRQRLRAEQPLLSKTHTQKYRNTYIHSLSLDMLAAGFHLSFKELFSLINQQEADRQRAGPESVMWTQVMIVDEEEKLDILQKYLSEAETAERKGDFEEVYKARYQLAVYFENSGDKWLSDHFYDTCLTTSSNIKSDGGRLQAEGECNVGLALEKSGRHFEAAEHFELYYNLSCDHDDWMKEEVTFHRDACINLYHINSVIGQELQDSDPEQSLEFLLKAFNKAKESCDRQLEGEAAYELGLAYERIGDGETALLHLNRFLETCKRAQDDEGIGRACDAIAKAYSRKGQVEESIQYLKQFVETAERSKKETELSKACHNLGNLYNRLGKYEEAAEYFSKAYNISRSLGETMSINTNRVQYGISLAHRMMSGFGAHLVETSQPYLERIVEWKSSRTDEFDKPFPEPKPVEEKQPEPEVVIEPEKSTEELEEEQNSSINAMESQEETADVNPNTEREITADTTITMTTEPTESSIGE